MNNGAEVLRTLTVNEVVARWPRTLAIFQSRGIDTCCGGVLLVSTVAERHGLDSDELFEALELATRPIARV